MNATPHPFPGLFAFLSRAKVVGDFHGIPIETVVMQGLALASTVAGDLIFTQPSGAAEWVKAKVPLLLVTGDAAMPWWARSAVEGVLASQEAVLSHQDRSKPTELVVAGLEEKKRVMIALGHGEGKLFGRTVPDPALLMIDERIRLTKNLDRYRHLRRVGGRGSIPSPTEGFSCSLLAEGKKDYLAILRTCNRPDDPVSALASSWGSGRSIVGWLAERDLRPVAGQAGVAWFSELGWMIGAPPANGSSLPEAKVPVSVDVLLTNVEVMRLTATPFKFSPHPVARDFLERQSDEIGNIIAQLPAGQIQHAIRDRHLAWHLGALLAVISGEALYPVQAMTLYCKLGAFLASKVIRHHVHRFRQLFPADNYGEFAGLDLAILRSLTNVPQKVRSIQRRLRDTSKTRCLVALHRACDAGLAVCVNGECFAESPIPPPGLGVSEALSELSAAAAFPERKRAKAH